MTLAALHNNKVYYSIEIDDKFGKEKDFYCIGCKEELIFHRNICGIRTKHFAHISFCLYESEPESEEHIIKKMWLYKHISNIYKKHKPDSIMVGDQKPDILLELKSQKIAIEIQCSPLSYEKWLERTKKYSEKGIYVFWVFGSKWIKLKSNEKRVSIIERELYNLNYGRNYYLFLDEYINGITPIHYQGIVRTIDPCLNCNSGFPCDKCQYDYLRHSSPKTLKTLIRHPKIYKKDIKLHIFENKGLKLVKLSDYTWWKKENDPRIQYFNQRFNQTK